MAGFENLDTDETSETLDDDYEEAPSADSSDTSEDSVAREGEPSTAEELAAVYRQENSLHQIKKMWDLRRIPGVRAVQEFFDEDQEGFNLNARLDEHGIKNEDRHFFEGVKNDKQLDVALDYYSQDQEDEALLNDVGTAKRIALSLAVGTVDPIYWIPIGRALKFGRTLVRAAATGAVLGGVDYSLRSKANNEFELEDLAVNTVAGALTVGLLEGAVRVTSPIFKKTKEAIKEMIKPTSEWFAMKDGILENVSQGKLGALKQQAKRIGWTVINNSPLYQMLNSGDELLKSIAPKIFRSRIVNYGDINKPLGITVEEEVDLYLSKELQLAEKINNYRNDFIKRGGSKEAFDKQVALEIVSFEVDENSKIISKSISTDPAVLKAAKERMDFDQQYIDEAIKYGVLDKNFGSEPIKTRGNKLVVDKALAKSDDINIAAFAIPPRNVTAYKHIVRKYNINNILEHLDDFADLLEKEVRLNHPKMPEKKVKAKVYSELAAITGYKIEGHAIKSSIKKGKVIRRNIAISDDVLLERGFLDYDSALNHIDEFRQLVVETGLNRVAREAKYKSWDAMLEAYEKKANINIGKSFEQIAAEEEISRETHEVYSYNLKLLKDTELLLKGTFSETGALKNNKIIGWIASKKEYIYAAQVGNMFLSILPDLASLVLRRNFIQGTRNLSRDVAKSLKKISLKSIDAVRGLKDSFKSINKTELRKVFSILDRAARNNRLNGLGNVSGTSKFGSSDKTELQKAFGFLDRDARNNRLNDLGYVPGISKFGSKLARFEDTYSGVNLITRSLEESAVQGEYSTLIKECLKGALADRKYLNKMGITEEFQVEIASTFEKYGSVDKHLYGDIYYVDPVLFNDAKLTDQLTATMHTIAGQTIMMPGAGDVPRALRSDLGSAFYMFKTFPFLLQNNFFRPLFSGGIPLSLGAATIAAYLSLSFGRKILKDMLEGNESDFDSIEFWKEVVEYSNLTPAIIDISLTGYELFDNPRRGIANSASPVISFVDRVIQLVRGLTSSGERRGKTWKNFRNMLPGTNIWWARPIENWVFDD